MHGSRSGGNTDGIQIESPSSFRTEEIRPKYAKALAKTMQRYMDTHYGFKGNSTLIKMVMDRSTAAKLSAFHVQALCSYVLFLLLSRFH